MKILYFAPIYYTDMKQRPQQIAERLSYYHQVYYIEPTISSIRKLLKGGDRKCRGERKRINKNMVVIRLNGYFTFHKSMEMFDFLGINNWSETIQLRKVISCCDLIWVGYSGWYTVVRHIKNKPIIFDKMDEEDLLANSRFLKKTLYNDKIGMVKIADVFIATCEKFYQDLKKYGKPVYLIPNAVSESMEMLPRKKQKINPNIVVGYVGTIGKWFDMRVIDELLKLDNKLQIILVGKNYLPENKNSRVKYLGVKENVELPSIINEFDICLYNFKPSELLDTINPVKIYEYLSINKPVLAIKSVETMKLSKYLLIYESIDDIKNFSLKDINPPFDDEFDRKKFVNENSWNARVKKINSIIEKFDIR